MFSPEKVELMSRLALYMRTEARKDPVTGTIMLQDGSGTDTGRKYARRFTPAENAICSVMCCVLFAALAVTACYCKAGDLDLITDHIPLWLIIFMVFTAAVTVTYVKAADRWIRSRVRDGINTTYRYKVMSEKLSAIVREEKQADTGAAENKEEGIT